MPPPEQQTAQLSVPCGGGGDSRTTAGCAPGGGGAPGGVVSPCPAVPPGPRFRSLALGAVCSAGGSVSGARSGAAVEPSISGPRFKSSRSIPVLTYGEDAVPVPDTHPGPCL